MRRGHRSCPLRLVASKSDIVHLVIAWRPGRGPLPKGPSGVGSPRRQGRTPLRILVPGLFHAQGPHRPTKVVTGPREGGHRPRHFPILREATGLPHLPPIPVPSAAVGPLAEPGGDHHAGRRQRPRRPKRPEHPRVVTFTPRPFSRSLGTVADVRFGGSPFLGFLGRPGRPVRGGSRTSAEASTIAARYAGYASEALRFRSRPPVRSWKSGGKCQYIPNT